MSTTRSRPQDRSQWKHSQRRERPVDGDNDADGVEIAIELDRGAASSCPVDPVKTRAIEANRPPLRRSVDFTELIS